MPSLSRRQAVRACSLALLPLRRGAIDSAEEPAFGLLVLGSPDPHRFEATMGTDYLARIAELQARLSHEFGLPVSAYDLKLLPHDLSDQQEALEQVAQCMEGDLQRVREGGDGELRRWLREQARLAKEHARARASGPFGWD